MIIQETGEIDDGFYVVGSAGVPVYLLDGPVPVLFDAGLTAGAYLYEAGEYHLEPDEIELGDRRCFLIPMKL